ncbi:hypothetical protein GCM10010972_32560 [Cellulomonas carbonis]|nr:hypothetical protein GCM10010972_32560 [Cellulomonas carbonis]
MVIVLAGAALVAAPPASADPAVRGWTLVVAAPATVVAGVPFDVAVTVVNPGGRPVGHVAGTVALATDDPLARTVPAAHAFVRGDRGTHTFGGVVLVGTGTWSLTATLDGRHPAVGSTSVVVRDAGAALEGQVLSGMDPVEGGVVTVYDAVTGKAVGSGPADIDGYRYRITGLPAGAVKVGAVVPGPYEPDFANDRDTLAAADVFTLVPGETLVQSWAPEDFGPYLDVRRVW